MWLNRLSFNAMDSGFVQVQYICSILCMRNLWQVVAKVVGCSPKSEWLAAFEKSPGTEENIAR
jgi:hypothetical protein